MPAKLTRSAKDGGYPEGMGGQRVTPKAARRRPNRWERGLDALLADPGRVPAVPWSGAKLPGTPKPSGRKWSKLTQPESPAAQRQSGPVRCYTPDGRLKATIPFEQFAARPSRLKALARAH